MPSVFILAGPNGTGKTTYYETGILSKAIIPKLSFINVDLIARSFPGGYLHENFIKAEEIARERIGDFLRRKEDFMIESNLATQRDYDWINAVVKIGYEVVLFFLCTSRVEINKAELRCAWQRVAMIFPNQSLNIDIK